jgi:hypothetical protein
MRQPHSITTIKADKEKGVFSHSKVLANGDLALLSSRTGDSPPFLDSLSMPPWSPQMPYKIMVAISNKRIPEEQAAFLQI